MNDVILVISGGKRPEYPIVDKLGKLVRKRVIKAYWHSDLRNLIHQIKEDEYLDYASFLRGKEGNEELDTISLDQISSTFLFFDYDPIDAVRYDTTQGGLNGYNKDIASLLALCNDETQRLGKLFISYPMVEALWHIQPNQDAMDCLVSLNVLRQHGYKQFIQSKSILRSLNLTDIQLLGLLKTHLERNLKFLSIANWNRDTDAIRTLTHEKEADFSERLQIVLALSPFPYFVIDAGNDADWKRLQQVAPLGCPCQMACLLSLAP